MFVPTWVFDGYVSFKKILTFMFHYVFFPKAAWSCSFQNVCSHRYYWSFKCLFTQMLLIGMFIPINCSHWWLCFSRICLFPQALLMVMVLSNMVVPTTDGQVSFKNVCPHRCYFLLCFIKITWQSCFIKKSLFPQVLMMVIIYIKLLVPTGATVDRALVLFPCFHKSPD